MNKIDRLEGMKPHLDKNEQGQVERVWVSALTGEGLEELQAALRNRLGQDMMDETVVLKPSQGRLRAILYQKHAIVSEQVTDDGGFSLHVRMPRVDWVQLMRRGEGE